MVSLATYCFSRFKCVVTTGRAAELLLALPGPVWLRGVGLVSGIGPVLSWKPAGLLVSARVLYVLRELGSSTLSALAYLS